MLPVVTVNKYLQKIFFFLSRIKNPTPPSVPNRFWLSPPLKQGGTIVTRGGWEGKGEEKRSPVSELDGAPPWKGKAPALQNRLHRQTHSAASASSRRYGDQPCGEGWGDGLGFPEYQKWSAYVDVCSVFFVFVFILIQVPVNGLHGSSAEEEKKRCHLMSRWRWMKRRGLGREDDTRGLVESGWRSACSEAVSFQAFYFHKYQRLVPQVDLITKM